MEVRVLKPEEFGLMDQIPEPDRIELNPDNMIVVGAFIDNRLIGRLVAIALPHIEGAWISSDYRSGLVLARMDDLLVRHLKLLGAKSVAAFAVNPKMENYCRRLGYLEFATAWKKEV